MKQFFTHPVERKLQCPVLGVLPSSNFAGSWFGPPTFSRMSAARSEGGALHPKQNSALVARAVGESREFGPGFASRVQVLRRTPTETANTTIPIASNSHFGEL